MNFSLTEKPLSVATITQPGDLEFLAAGYAVPSNVLEFRLDNLVELAEQSTKVMRTVERPTLLTVRRRDEGGSNELDDETRLDLYSNHMSGTEVIDTEITSLESEAFSGFVSKVEENNSILVASFHDFSSWPGLETIRAKVDLAYELGAAVPKVAIVIEEMSDLFDLAELVSHHRSEGRLISAMGMGPLGKLSRLVLAKAGSCLNYGYLKTPNAPGQWSAEDLNRLISDL